MSAPSPSDNARSASRDGDVSPRGRWKTNARIEAVNEQHRWNRRQTHLRPLVGIARSESSVGSSPLDDLPELGATDSRAAAEQKTFLRDDRLPSWLVSLLVHMALVILLALLGTAQGGRSGSRLLVQWSEANKTESLLQSGIEFATAAPAETTQTAHDSQQTAAQVAEPPLASEIMDVRNPLEPQPQGDSRFRPSTSSASGLPVSLMTQIGGGAIGDRSAAARAAAVGSGETSAAAEDALESALRWLAEHQHTDGGWSFRLEDPRGPCQGKCEHFRSNPDDAPIPRTAATGLALLAFLGAGHTHQAGEYAENIRRGFYFLRGEARETSMGLDLQNGSMYGHGIATFAIAEGMALARDEDLRDLLEGTIFFACGAQHSSGGWGYLPSSPPDMTLTAWHVVALKTAEQCGVRSPTTVIPDAKAFVATLANPLGNRFGYRSPEPERSTTAMGLLLQMYFGSFPSQTEIREGLDYLAAEGPSPTDVYYNYYAMLALHHSRHPERIKFAEKLREHLVQTQAREGHEQGSWNFRDRYGSVGGRLYTTALAALILETPYRYAPIYDPDRPFAL